VQCIYQFHKYTQTPEEAVSVALRDGWTDINSGGTYYSYLASALAQKQCNMSDVDGALFRSLRIRFELGLFDPVEHQPFWNIPLSAVHSAAAVEHSRFAAEQSMVLLKNANRTVLPLPNATKSSRSGRGGGAAGPPLRTLAVIGPSGNDSSVLLGNYLGWLCPNGMSDFSCVDTIVDAIRPVAASNGWAVSFAPGTAGHREADPTLLQAAVTLAKASDHVLLAVGLDEGIEAEMLDRTSIALPDAQKQLVAALASAGIPPSRMSMVLINGGVVAIEDELPLVGAVLEAWYPGMYGGPAIARTIFGLANPGGKLPVTMYYANYTSQIKMSDMSMTAGVGRSYRYLQVPALFRFGFGLSYSEFLTQCSFVPHTNNQMMSSGFEKNSSGIVGNVSCTVALAPGSPDGSEVLQVYMVPYPIPDPGPVRPQAQLIRFNRIHLSSSSSSSASQVVKDVNFTVTTEDFCLVDATGRRSVMPANYGLEVSTDGRVTSILKASVYVETGSVNPCEQII
jgi:hypothetical protein